MGLWAKIRYVIRECVVLPLLIVPCGVIYTKIRFNRKDTLYVLIYQGIGDAVVSLGYLNAYIRKWEEENAFHYQNICLIRKGGMKEVYSMYRIGQTGQTCRELVVSDRIYQFLCVYHETPVGFKSINGTGNFLFVHTYNYIKDNWNYFYRMPGMTFMNFIKTGIYDLPDWAEFERPSVPAACADVLREKYKTTAGRYVILNPFANTIHSRIGEEFWTELSAVARKSGYQVFTDCGKGDKPPIPGTKALVSTLSELYALGGDAGAYIGIRSGVMDFLLFGGARIMALYPAEAEPDGNEIFDAFDINGINRMLGRSVNDHCRQMKIEDQEQTIARIMQFLAENGKEWEI